MIGTSRIPRLPRPSRISSFVASRMGPPVIEPSTLRDVLGRYGLRQERSGRNLRLGRRSRNVAIATDHGIKVVKLYRPQWTEDTVRHGHSILLRLEELDVPAVRLVRTPQGETWTSHADGLFAVFDFVEGANYSLTYLRRSDRLQLTGRAAGALVDLHRQLDGFVPDGRHHLGFDPRTGRRVRDVDWHAAKLDELRDRSVELEDPEAMALAERLIDRAGEVLEQIVELESRLDGDALPRLVIHGDFGLHNLIFDSTGTPVPVDFEVARLDRRVNDLISAAGKYRFSDGSYDIASITTFFRAYAARFALGSRELDLLPDAWRLYRLRAAVQYWNSYFETAGPARKLSSALHAVGQASWVAEHPEVMDRLRSAAGGTEL